MIIEYISNIIVHQTQLPPQRRSCLDAMIKPFRASLSIFIAISLATTLYYNFHSRYHQSTPTDVSELDDLRSLEVQLPAGARAVELDVETYRRVLGANEIYYKAFRHGGDEFEVYIAHWAAGNPFSGHASRHPPDLCWENAGWFIADRLHPRSIHIRDRLEHTAEWRRFRAENGAAVEALFWCVSGTRLAISIEGRTTAREFATAPSNPFIAMLHRSGFFSYWLARLDGGQSAEMQTQNDAGRHALDTSTFFVRINTAGDVYKILSNPALQSLNPLFHRVGLGPEVHSAPPSSD